MRAFRGKSAKKPCQGVCGRPTGQQSTPAAAPTLANWAIDRINAHFTTGMAGQAGQALNSHERFVRVTWLDSACDGSTASPPRRRANNGDARGRAAG